MINEIKKNLETSMSKTIESLKGSLSKVRTGRASANSLDGIVVDYYNTPTPIAQVGQISTPEARVLQIHPFDRNLISEIEKSIINSNLGLTPSNDGNLIRIPFPALTEEKRKEKVREIKKIGENSKIQLRNTRREQNEVVKDAEKKKELSKDESKKYQENVQEITNKYTKDVDVLIEAKEKELLTI